MTDGFRLLITGASRGLGRALAVCFALRGYQLLLTARTEGGLAELSDEIVANGGLRPSLVVMDLRCGEQIDRLGATIGERYGGLDGVILNAAHLGVLSPVEHGGVGLWQELFTVNVLANQRLLRCLHGLLLIGAGSVGGIVVGVTCGEYRGEAFWGGYGASKVAFATMLASYSRENSRPGSGVGLCIHCIDPGKMSTALRRGAFPGEEKDKYPITEKTLAPFIEVFCTNKVS